MANGFSNIFHNEVQHLLQNRTLLTFIVIFPVLLFSFFKGFMDTGVIRELPIAVVDHDNSFGSRTFLQYINATPELRISYKVNSRLEAESLIRTAKTYGFLVIPKGFARDLELGRQPIIINQFNQNLLLPGGLEERAVRSAINALSTEAQLNIQLAKGKTPQEAMAVMEPVRLDTHVISNPYLNYRYYLLAGFLPMFLQVFVMLTTIYVIGWELKHDRGKRLFAIGNGNMLHIILGKLLPYSLWFFLLGVSMYLGMYLFMDYPINGNRLMLLLALVLLILATQAFAFIFVVISKNLRMAMTMGNAMAAVSLTMCGFTFPIMGMLPFFQWASKMFPFTHYFEMFKDLTQRGIPSYYVLPEVVILVLMTLVLFAMGSEKYKNLLQQGGYLATSHHETT